MIGRIDADGVQRGVVPGELVERLQAGDFAERSLARFLGAAAERDLAPVIGHQEFEGLCLRLRDHDDHHRLAGRRIGREPAQIGNDLRVVHGHELLGDAVALGEGVRETRRGRERRERRDPLAPGMARGQRHLDLGDDAVHAIGMHHLEHVAATQLDHARMLFDGDDLDGEHRARIGNLSPGAGAGAGRAAGDEAADGRVLAGGRIEAQLVRGRRQRAIDVEHARAGPKRPAPGRCQITWSSLVMSSTTPPASGTAWP